jgi:hypothetical protein
MLSKVPMDGYELSKLLMDAYKPSKLPMDVCRLSITLTGDCKPNSLHYTSKRRFHK